MKFLVGTSGYSYKEWKGSFYPEKLPDKNMLGSYAQHFRTVEINSTFRRFPSASTVESWAEQVPDTFRFVLKARQTITHFRRLQNADEQIDDFINLASLLEPVSKPTRCHPRGGGDPGESGQNLCDLIPACAGMTVWKPLLGKRQGPLLFQLPPNFKKDVARLDAFLNYAAGRAAVVLQLQHESWFSDDVYSCLRAHSAALCSVDDDGPACNKVVGTTNWGYVRLREERYTDARLKKWIGEIKDQNWNEVYVFFKHEDVGAGPKLAARILELAGR